MVALFIRSMRWVTVACSATRRSTSTARAMPSRTLGAMPRSTWSAPVSDLDKRAPGQVRAAQASPHGLVQQFLNRTDDHLWAFVPNGLKLRLLRDNVSLTRLAYVEFDLAAMTGGERATSIRRRSSPSTCPPCWPRKDGPDSSCRAGSRRTTPPRATSPHRSRRRAWPRSTTSRMRTRSSPGCITRSNSCC